VTASFSSPRATALDVGPGAATPAAGDVRIFERQELGDVGDALVIVIGVVRALVVRELDVPPALGLVHRALDRLGHLVGVEQHPAVEVPGGAADGLHERGLVAEEALLVCVRIATSDTSGRSSPSRRRLIPTSTSYSPSRSRG
jgi:hypothetical protein